MRDDFSYRLTLDRIRDGERIDLVADEQQRGALAGRLRLVSLERLEANATLERDGQQVRARGRVRALLEQSCVATGVPVREHVDEPFEIAFVPEPREAAPDEEVELTPEDCDIVFYEGGAIDLGAAIGDTLGLAIDPYPRSPEADSALAQAGVVTEEQASPFAALAKLKKGGDES